MLGAGIGRVGGIGQPAIWRRNAFLLDRLGIAPSAAYSTRRLRAGYTGNLVRLRNSGNGVEQDIFATPIGDLDTAAVLAMGSAATGVNLMDQSGNGSHATQSTAAAQPVAVSGGALETIGGRFAFGGDGLNRFFALPTFTAPLTIIAVVQPNVTGGGTSYRTIVATPPAGTGGNVFLANTDSGSWGTWDVSDRRSNTNLAANTAYVLAMSGGSFYTNSAPDGTYASSSGQAPGSIFGSVGQRFNGKIAEIICFPSTLNIAQIRAISADMGAYFSIPQVAFQNLAPSPTNLNGSDWYSISGATMTGNNTVNMTTASASGREFSMPYPGGTAGKTITFAARVRTESGTKQFRLTNTHGGVQNNASNDMVATTTAQTFVFTVTNNSSSGSGNQNFSVRQGSSLVAGSLIVEAVGVYAGAYSAAQIEALGGIA